MGNQKTLSLEELLLIAKDKGITGTPEGIASTLGVSYTKPVEISMLTKEELIQKATENRNEIKWIVALKELEKKEGLISDKNFESDSISGITGIESFSFSVDELEIKEIRSKGFEAFKEALDNKLKDSGFTGFDNLGDNKSIIGPVGVSGTVDTCSSYTGYVGKPEEESYNEGIGYTGLQELLKKAASGAVTYEDLMFYSGKPVKVETEEDKRLREEIENLSDIWMLQPLECCPNSVITASPSVPQVEPKKEKFTLKKLKLAISEKIIVFGQYLKGEVQYQQTRIIKLLVPCKKCKGLGFKKKLFSKKYEKGTMEYKNSYNICKHCKGNGVVKKDISKKSIQFINKVTKVKKCCSEGTTELYR